MTWIDGAILAVLAVSALLALARGLVHEVLGIAAWAGAVAAAIIARPILLPLLESSVEPAWLAEALVTGGTFFIVLILLNILVAGLARGVQSSVLGGVDRALGFVFGLARGAFLVALAYILGGLVFPTPERWPDAIRDARALPLAAEAAQMLASALPADWRPRLVPPPDRPGPGLEDLVRPPARDRI